MSKLIATAALAALTLATPALAGGISPGAAVGLGVGSLLLGGALGAQAQPYYGQDQTYYDREPSPRYYAPRRHRRYAQPRYRRYRQYAPQYRYAPQQYDNGYGYAQPQQCYWTYDSWGQQVQQCQ